MSADGRVCDVSALRSPSDHQKSVQINQRALPVLHDRVVAAHSATVDAVSGATFTSLGYKQSLQGILDSVGR